MWLQILGLGLGFNDALGLEVAPLSKNANMSSLRLPHEDDSKPSETVNATSTQASRPSWTLARRNKMWGELG